MKRGDRERHHRVLRGAEGSVATVALAMDGHVHFSGMVVRGLAALLDDAIAKLQAVRDDFDRPSSFKHGPNGSGGDGPCDEDCHKCELEKRR